MDRDIVSRLRDSQPEGTTGGFLLNDAADEIIRLRASLAECHSLLMRMATSAETLMDRVSAEAFLPPEEHIFFNKFREVRRLYRSLRSNRGYTRKRHIGESG